MWIGILTVCLAAMIGLAVIAESLLPKTRQL